MLSPLLVKRRVHMMPAKTTSAETVSLPPTVEEVYIRNKDALEKIVAEELWKIEGGLTVIGCEVPADDNKVVDILCHDYNGQLVLLMLSIKDDDSILFEGLQTLNEVNRVRQMLKYFNKDQKINDKEPARLILVAPSFSDNLLTIANGITNVRMSLYEWEYLQFGENKALRVTPVSLPEAPKNRK
jgi:RecB family endonuclease NucS